MHKVLTITSIQNYKNLKKIDFLTTIFACTYQQKDAQLSIMLIINFINIIYC